VTHAVGRGCADRALAERVWCFAESGGGQRGQRGQQCTRAEEEEPGKQEEKEDEERSSQGRGQRSWWVFGADVVYDGGSFRALARTLELLLRQRPRSQAVLAIADRCFLFNGRRGGAPHGEGAEMHAPGRFLAMLSPDIEVRALNGVAEAESWRTVTTTGAGGGPTDENDEACTSGGGGVGLFLFTTSTSAIVGTDAARRYRNCSVVRNKRPRVKPPSAS
jgi:hypothetical protein